MCNKVTHKQDCKRVFSRYDMSCPRCIELANGAKARPGYGNSRQQADANRLAEIKAHYVNGKCNCGPVCTKFDW